MKNLLLFSLLILTSACAPQFQGEGLKIEAAFQPYVNRFVEEAQKQGRPVVLTDLTVEIDYSMSPPANGKWTLGICTISSTKNPRVRINPSFWNNDYYTAAEREELMFHELSHCVLKRGHLEATTTSADGNYQVPVSIMFPYHLGASRYTANYRYYMSELFGSAPAPTNLVVFGPTQFDGSVYTALASLFSNEETREYKAVASGKDVEFGSIEGMGCGEEEHEH